MGMVVICVHGASPCAIVMRYHRALVGHENVMVVATDLHPPNPSSYGVRGDGKDGSWVLHLESDTVLFDRECNVPLTPGRLEACLQSVPEDVPTFSFGDLGSLGSLSLSPWKKRHLTIDAYRRAHGQLPPSAELVDALAAAPDPEIAAYRTSPLPGGAPHRFVSWTELLCVRGDPTIDQVIESVRHHRIVCIGTLYSAPYVSALRGEGRSVLVLPDDHEMGSIDSIGIIQAVVDTTLGRTSAQQMASAHALLPRLSRAAGSYTILCPSHGLDERELLSGYPGLRLDRASGALCLFWPNANSK